MGAVSYETDRDHDLAPRQTAKYKTESGKIHEVPFAEDVATAAREGADGSEIAALSEELVAMAKDIERLR